MSHCSCNSKRWPSPPWGLQSQARKKNKDKKNTRRRSPFFTAGQRLFSSEAERRGQLSCAIKAQQAARRNASRLGGLRANILVPNVPFGAGRHQGQQPSRRKGSECWLSITRVVPFCFPFLSLSVASHCFISIPLLPLLSLSTLGLNSAIVCVCVCVCVCVLASVFVFASLDTYQLL